MSLHQPPNTRPPSPRSTLCTLAALFLATLPVTVQAQIIFTSDFETGSIPDCVSSPDGWQDNNLTGRADALMILGPSTNPVLPIAARTGTKAARIYAKITDYQNPDTRIEISTSCTDHPANHFVPGTEYWVGWSIYIPSNWIFENNSQTIIMAQFRHKNDPNNCANGVSPPNSLELRGNRWNGSQFVEPELDDRWTWRVYTQDDSYGQCNSAQSDYYDMGVVTRGKWTDFVVRFKPSSTNTGILQVWVDGVLKVSRLNQPNHHKNDLANPPLGTTFRTGFYNVKWGDPNWTTNTTERLYYLDSYKVYQGTNGYSQVAPPAAAPQLIGHWMLNETSGTTAADSSGSGNTGTLSGGATWTTGQVGGGLSFDGVDDLVNAGSGSSTDNLPTVSVVAWIKPNSIGEGSFGRIVQKGTGTSPTAGWRFLTQGTNQLTFAVDYSTTDLSRVSATNAFATGAWRHVAATWSGTSSASDVRIYVNGAEVGSYVTTTNGVGTRDSDSAASLFLGNDSTGGRTFDGVLDDVRVYNGVLSASDILAIYQAGPPSPPSGLAATAVSYNQINLAWTDNSGNETGFKIERKKGSGGTYAQIDTAAANTASYNDTTAGAGTTYYYRVRSYNGTGDSAYSNEANATSSEITSGRQAHWKLDEASGTSAADSSGNGNTGTLTSGPAWVAGKIANGLSFDGVDDLVNAGSGATTDNLAAVTVSAWIKANSIGEGSFGRIVQKGTGTGPTAGWRILTQGTNQISFAVDYSTTDMVRVTAINAFTPGAWKHVLATWTGSATATNVHIYLDGVEVGSYATTTNGVGTRNNDSAANVYLGNDSTAARTFDGALDDVRIYNRVLSTAEITAIHRAGL